jgi:hypothetical protein
MVKRGAAPPWMPSLVIAIDPRPDATPVELARVVELLEQLRALPYLNVEGYTRGDSDDVWRAARQARLP